MIWMPFVFELILSLFDQEKAVQDGASNPEIAVELTPEEVEEDIKHPLGGSKPQRYFFVINNGHGKLQRGKRSPVVDFVIALLGGVNLFEEWRYTRYVARMIVRELQRRGIACMLLVPEDNVGMFLTRRMARANAVDTNLDRIGVGVHFNAAGSLGKWYDDIRGYETWFESVSGRKIASVFQRHLVPIFTKDRGIRKHLNPRNKFTELTASAYPWVITENDFYTSREGIKHIVANLDKIAMAHVEAIQEIENNGYENVADYPIIRYIA